MPLHPRRLVRAAADPPIELVTIPNVQLLEVGEDWETSTGVFTWTEEDVQSAVESAADPSIRTPVIKLGHTDPRFDGQFSIGRIENLALANNGQTVLGDYVGLPAWLAEVMPSAYPRRSIEGWFSYKSRTGNEWPFILTACALLGEAYPAINTLEDIEAFWRGEPMVMEQVAANAPYVLAGSNGGMMIRANRVEADVPKWRKNKKAEAAVQVDDVRREYYDSLDASQMWWWIRAVMIDPAQLIVDDDEGNLYRVAYSISGDTVEFSDPVEVKIEYVDVAAAAGATPHRFEAPVAASAVYPTREMSRSGIVAATSPEEEPSMTPEQKALIGLAADATDEQVNAKLAELAKASTTDTPPEGDPPNPDDPPKPDDTPAPEGTPAPEVPEGQVLVDAAAWEETQAAIKDFRSQQVSAADSHRRTVLDEAVKAGKFPPSRREHYEALLKTDPVGGEAAIKSLAAGLVPVSEIGHGGTDQGADGGGAADAYPSHWLPEVQARQTAGTVTKE